MNRKHLEELCTAFRWRNLSRWEVQRVIEYAQELVRQSDTMAASMSRHAVTITELGLDLKQANERLRAVGARPVIREKNK